MHLFRPPAPVKLTTTDWPSAGPILDQGQIGGCVGWTGADMLNTDAFTPVRAKSNGDAFYNNDDGLRFYELATRNDAIPGAYPPNDTGSSGLGLAKALRKLGLITGYSHAYGWQAFQTALMLQPIAVGTLWTQTMFQPDADGLVHVGDLTDDNIAGGHEYMIRGINYETQQLRGRNHWSPQWGDDGEFNIGFADFEMLLAAQADAIVLHGVGCA